VGQKGIDILDTRVSNIFCWYFRALLALQGSSKLKRGKTLVNGFVNNI
jgi:hypothetical protein